MAKPVDNNDNKNPNNKKGFEMTATNAILLSNVILIIVIVVSMITTYSLLTHTIDKKISQIILWYLKFGAPRGVRISNNASVARF